MCWENEQWFHCYECQKEWGHQQVHTPCFAVENGVPCPGVTKRPPVVADHENCQECKDARKAEEICQQHVHHSKPLVFEFRKKKESLRLNREANAKSQQPPKPRGEVDPDLVSSPPFVTMRTQPNTGGPRV
ncbi:hypothetical protein GGS23DRAFT_595777 [Durotheca rogersii]|uniref:uncharacterized protein n=1 Tax=Durotheca rogersii TaxID=419775 RepID=UPI0022204B1C|nr:uncharacterized protein GGS23DRAFT_595777 [Durotheca rogersii]KAI5864130.1 hypothetical protein GGS23DRAFT_595777 [Durotheca rogersii]